jgi:hypothetical protein
MGRTGAGPPRRAIQPPGRGCHSTTGLRCGCDRACVLGQKELLQSAQAAAASRSVSKSQGVKAATGCHRHRLKLRAAAHETLGPRYRPRPHSANTVSSSILRGFTVPSSPIQPCGKVHHALVSAALTRSERTGSTLQHKQHIRDAQAHTRCAHPEQRNSGSIVIVSFADVYWACLPLCWWRARKTPGWQVPSTRWTRGPRPCHVQGMVFNLLAYLCGQTHV